MFGIGNPFAANPFAARRAEAAAAAGGFGSALPAPVTARFTGGDPLAAFSSLAGSSDTADVGSASSSGPNGGISAGCDGAGVGALGSATAAAGSKRRREDGADGSDCGAPLACDAAAAVTSVVAGPSSSGKDVSDTPVSDDVRRTLDSGKVARRRVSDDGGPEIAANADVEPVIAASDDGSDGEDGKIVGGDGAASADEVASGGGGGGITARPVYFSADAVVDNGEEGEVAILQLRAKLYVMDRRVASGAAVAAGVGTEQAATAALGSTVAGIAASSGRWRECGTGPIRINARRDAVPVLRLVTGLPVAVSNALMAAEEAAVAKAAALEQPPSAHSSQVDSESLTAAAPNNAPADAAAVAPADAPADVPSDAPALAPVDAPTEAPADASVAAPAPATGSSVAAAGPAARLIMRQEMRRGGRGTRLLLNSALFADMPISVHPADARAVQFCCSSSVVPSVFLERRGGGSASGGGGASPPRKVPSEAPAAASPETTPADAPARSPPPAPSPPDLFYHFLLKAATESEAADFFAAARALSRAM